MTDSTATVSSFLEATAAKTPTPGGGSVTALVGALSAAIGEMVVNYSLGKKGLEEHQPALAEAQKELSNARKLLLQLLAEDQLAYVALRDAKKLPDGPEKAQALNAAVKACVGAPQAMGATAARLLEIADRMVNLVNPYLLSDLAVCADLAMATARCASYNVRVNLPDIKDVNERRAVERTTSEVLSHAAVLIQRASPRIWARVMQPGG
jgi:formiminotetrahydrofolate cyclodeaminase